MWLNWRRGLKKVGLTFRGFSSQILPTEADVVIIGGGSIGCNTLYHLAKKGVTNAVLLERDKLTSGTTWHTAGLVWRLRPNETDVRLIGRTHEILQELENETGIDPGWINNGGLFIANNRERLDEYKRLHTFGKAFGIESHVLDPEETKKLYPLMNVDDVFATLYSPADGTVDPNGFCAALTRFATKAGAKVIEGCSVENILSEEGTFKSRRVSAVVTNRGTIKTNNVVNCTGVWANHVSNKVGISTPLLAMKHAYVTTERIEGIENMPNVRDHDASVYLKLQGDALHIGGYENNPVFWDQVEKSFSFGLFELDWDVFGVHIEGAVNRVPIVEKTGIKSTVCGPESFTPDHKAIMGEDPDLSGYFHGCGFNSSGMMLGGGAGWQLAEWIVHDRPSIDMHEYDVTRFCPKVSRNVNWLRERSHESYAKNYSTVFPNDEPLAGRKFTKKSALHDELARRGCVFQEKHGWERPGWFGRGPCEVNEDYDWYGAYGHKSRSEDEYKRKLEFDYTFEYPEMMENIRKECLSARFSAALFDMSYFGKFVLSGPKATRAAEWIFTNEIEENPIDKVVYSCVLNERGGIEADLTVTILDAAAASVIGEERRQIGLSRSYYIVGSGFNAAHVHRHMNKALQNLSLSTEDVQLTEVTNDISVLSLQGPESREILHELLGDSFNPDLPYGTHQVARIGGITMSLLRVSFVGELGWEIHVRREDALSVYEAVERAFDVRKVPFINAGFRALDSLSIEKGYPHWHHEIRVDDSPREAGLLFACKKTKEYLGKKAVQAEKASKKKKVCLTLKNDGERNGYPLARPQGLEVIWRNGVVVGHVRRADFAFYLDRPIVYGYVFHPSGENVTESWLKDDAADYEIEVLGKRFAARLETTTPFDGKNSRLKGIYDDDTRKPSLHQAKLK